MASMCEFVVTSLPTPDVVENVVTGPGGLLTAARQGMIIIDTSTIDPVTTQRIARVAADKGIGFLDSPVSGGPKAAEDGNLTIMVSGNEQIFQKAKLIYDTLAQKIYYVGSSGQAQIIKLCHNTLCAIISIALGEVFVTASKAGIDISMIADIIRNSAGQNKILDVNYSSYVNSDHSKALFGLGLMKKDVELYAATVQSMGLCGIFGSLAADLFRSAVKNGNEKKNFTAIIESFRKLNGM
jgi:3-hydroxyisobutyrate dehydrogenase-like beta-hydroxyacid dehydrogenase